MNSERGLELLIGAALLILGRTFTRANASRTGANQEGGREEGGAEEIGGSRFHFYSGVSNLHATINTT